MALKISHLFYSLLWLSLLSLFFHQFYINFFSKTNPTTTTLSSLPPLTNRKVLASKFDFSPFLHRHRHRKQSPNQHESEVDPRYGVEKRLVPTGPNPLHH
ncbi:hypothetical protein LguiA_000521 [Lonicera macranthoides]